MSRFYNYPEAEELQNDDVFLIDGETDGTRKIPANKMADFFGEQVPTDKTLSIENKAADAKKTGDEIGELKSALDTLNEGGLVIKDEVIAEEIQTWLEDHPEATTTVQDHSLTYEKLVNGTLGYVTPEMYGAKGDGITDDSVPMMGAVQSGLPILLSGTYKLTQVMHFVQSVFSDKIGGIKTTTVQFFEGNNLDIENIIFDGLLSSPYIKCIGNNFNISGCVFKDFSGNESYKFTRALWLGDDITVYSGNVINNCIFDGLYCDYENGTIGGVQGSVRAIQITQSSTQINGCKFQNMNGVEDGDYIHISSKNTQNLEYPYNQHSNLEYDSCPCIITNNTFYCSRNKSAVKITASDVILANNILFVNYVDEENEGYRYVIRGYNCNNINVVNNIIAINNSSISSVFDFAGIKNLIISSNNVRDFSSNSSSVHTFRKLFSVVGILNGVIKDNIVMARKINLIIDNTFSVISVERNHFVFLDDLDEILYIQQWYVRSLVTNGLPENTGLNFNDNSFDFIGSRKSIYFDTGGMGKVSFKRNAFNGTLNDDKFEVYLKTDVILADNYEFEDIPYGLLIIQNATVTNEINFICKNTKLIGCTLINIKKSEFRNNDVSSSYQCITMSNSVYIYFDSNYVHNITNALFRILDGNTIIDISNNRFTSDMTITKLCSYYNNTDFDTKSIHYHKSNSGDLNTITYGATDDAYLTRDPGDMFYNTASGKLKVWNRYGYWLDIT